MGENNMGLKNVTLKQQTYPTRLMNEGKRGMPGQKFRQTINRRIGEGEGTVVKKQKKS